MSDRTEKIRELNDRLRQTGLGGQVLVTRGVKSLPDIVRQAIYLKVETFEEFTEDNDPHGEHDFGCIQHFDIKLFWKIDYYDPSMTMLSDDPSDPAITNRVLTIMLAEEY